MGLSLSFIAYATATGGTAPGKPVGAANAASTAITANGQQAHAQSTASGGSGLSTATATTTDLISITATSKAPVTAASVVTDSIVNSGTTIHASSAPSTTEAYAYSSALANFPNLGPNVGAVFNDPASITFGSGALGANYAAGAVGKQTYTSSIEWVLDPALTGLPPLGHLELGLINNIVTGAGFSNLVLSVIENGFTLLTQNFATVAAANAYFNDHVIDLGAWATHLPAGQLLNVKVNMQLTANAAGCYGFDFVLADPVTVPEPDSLALFAIGGLGMLGWSQRGKGGKKDNI